MAAICEPEMLEKQSKTLKTRIVAYFPINTAVKKTAWVGIKGTVTSDKNS